MSANDPLDLEQRVARLERLVARLLDQAGEGPTSAASGSGRAGARPSSAEATDAQPTARRGSPGEGEPWRWSWDEASDAEEPSGAGAKGSAGPGLADQGERWLGRVGIVFVVLAFGFLFKYAFDQGWIGPAFRVVLGLLAGTAMLGIGLRLEGSRERYSQYLLGGAVGLYYLVGFAAYELYSLVPFWVAFAFMCAVTVLAFVLAERQRLPSLAVIGAAGGLATPFLVRVGPPNVSGLVLYTTLLLAGAGALQLLRGWRSLLLVLGFGGLMVMALAVDAAAGPADILEAAITTVGILMAWAVFGMLPPLRAHLHRIDPQTWPDPPLPGFLARSLGPDRVALALLRLGCVVAAFVAVLELGGLFDVERPTLGVLYAAAFLVYLALARGLAETRPSLNAAAETASILLVLAITLFFFDYRVMLPLAVTGAAMHLAHDRVELPGVSLLAHLVFAELLILVLSRLEVLGVAVGSPFGMVQLAALGAIGLALSSSFVLASPAMRQAYRIGAHIAFMAWLATQLGPLERGRELISLSWGIYGIVLLLVSLRLRQRGLQLAGLATLGIVAAKLVVVDMAQVDVIWRILLFMGFGAAFLGLSYLINRQPESD